MANNLNRYCSHTTLGICTLNSVLLFASSLPHVFVKVVIDVVTVPSCILICINTILSISMCKSKCQNVNNPSLQIIIILTNSIMLTSNGHDTSRPLGIQFRSFINSVRDTKYNLTPIIWHFDYITHSLLTKLSSVNLPWYYDYDT